MDVICSTSAQRFVADDDRAPEGSKGRFEIAIVTKDGEMRKIRAKMVEIGSRNAMEKGKEDIVFNKKCETRDEQPSDSIILSSCAFVDNGIDHILDGYSWALMARVSGDAENLVVNVILRPVSADQKDRESERNGLRKFGLFTGHLRWWRKILCGGRALQLLVTGRAVDRVTAHQPIFYPMLDEAYFCSAYTYPAFKVHWESVGTLTAEEIPGKAYIWSKFPKNDYVCMHPLFEASSASVLTYTFLHSKIGRKTRVLFYEFGPGNEPEPIKVFDIDVMFNCVVFAQLCFSTQFRIAQLCICLVLPKTGLSCLQTVFKSSPLALVTCVVENRFCEP